MPEAVLEVVRMDDVFWFSGKKLARPPEEGSDFRHLCDGIIDHPYFILVLGDTDLLPKK